MRIEEIVRDEFRKFLEEKLGEGLMPIVSGVKLGTTRRHYERKKKGRHLSLQEKEEIYQYIMAHPRKSYIAIAKRFNIGDANVSRIMIAHGIRRLTWRGGKVEEKKPDNKTLNGVKQMNLSNMMSQKMKAFWSSPKGIEARKRQRERLIANRKKWGLKWKLRDRY
jgi:hypothetical protein